MELRKKGVAEDCIEAALEERGDESDAAISVAGKYLRGKEMTSAMIRKTYMYLLSKGFDYDTANAALRGIVAERKTERSRTSHELCIFQSTNATC